MNALLDFFRWLRDILVNVVQWLLTVKGLIVVAFADLIAFITGMVGEFTWTGQIGGWIDTATSQLNQLAATDVGAIGGFLIRWFAVDQLAISVTTLLSVTVGVVAVVFTGFVSSILLLVGGVLAIKAAMKLVSVASLGVLKP